MKLSNGFFFEYFYYRIAQFYWRWEKENSSRAVIAISMLESMTICNSAIILLRIFFRKNQITPFSKVLGISSIIIFLFFLVYNTNKYYNKFDSYKAEWQDEPKSTRVKKGLLILLLLVIPWAWLFIMIAE
jgi:hypothetical protein